MFKGSACKNENKLEMWAQEKKNAISFTGLPSLPSLYGDLPPAGNSEIFLCLNKHSGCSLSYWEMSEEFNITWTAFSTSVTFERRPIVEEAGISAGHTPHSWECTSKAVVLSPCTGRFKKLRNVERYLDGEPGPARPGQPCFVSTASWGRNQKYKNYTSTLLHHKEHLNVLSTALFESCLNTPNVPMSSVLFN